MKDVAEWDMLEAYSEITQDSLPDMWSERLSQMEYLLQNHSHELFTVNGHTCQYKRLRDVAVSSEFYILLDPFHDDDNKYSCLMVKIHDRTCTDKEDGLQPNIKYWRDKQWYETTMETDSVVCAVVNEAMYFSVEPEDLPYNDYFPYPDRWDLVGAVFPTLELEEDPRDYVD